MYTCMTMTLTACPAGATVIGPLARPSLGAQPCNFGNISRILEIQKAKLVRIENPTPVRRRTFPLSLLNISH